MPRSLPRTVCWSSTWNPDARHTGLEQVVLDERSADGVLLAFTESGVPFRLTYTLRWDDEARLRQAELASRQASTVRHLSLHADGEGHWTDAAAGDRPDLDGCIDIDIWPTPLTNSLPVWRSRLHIGERREFRMAWIAAPELTVQAQPQAYTRLDARRYRFESLDGSGFEAELPVDEDGLVLDYPGAVPPRARARGHVKRGQPA